MSLDCESPILHLEANWPPFLPVELQPTDSLQNQHHQSTPPINTTNQHHQSTPPINTTNQQHQSTPLSLFFSYFLPLGFFSHQHQHHLTKLSQACNWTAYVDKSSICDPILKV